MLLTCQRPVEASSYIVFILHVADSQQDTDDDRYDYCRHRMDNGALCAHSFAVVAAIPSLAPMDNEHDTIKYSFRKEIFVGGKSL